MKKIILSLAMVFMAIAADAQVTMNVRAGGGVNTKVEGLTGLFQVNIPFGKTSPFTFSPTVQANISLDCDETDGSQNLLLPLNIGYKTSIGKNCLFFPKIGPAIGYDIYSDDGFNAGPAVELAFELKHFVIALNGYYSITECTREYYSYYTYTNTKDLSPWNVSLTFGYKF